VPFQGEQNLDLPSASPPPKPFHYLYRRHLTRGILTCGNRWAHGPWTLAAPAKGTTGLELTSASAGVATTEVKALRLGTG
jgi:hypothetical protein